MVASSRDGSLRNRGAAHSASGIWTSNTARGGLVTYGLVIVAAFSALRVHWEGPRQGFHQGVGICCDADLERSSVAKTYFKVSFKSLPVRKKKLNYFYFSHPFFSLVSNITLQCYAKSLLFIPNMLSLPSYSQKSICIMNLFFQSTKAILLSRIYPFVLYRAYHLQPPAPPPQICSLEQLALYILSNTHTT